MASNSLGLELLDISINSTNQPLAAKLGTVAINPTYQAAVKQVFISQILIKKSYELLVILILFL